MQEINKIEIFTDGGCKGNGLVDSIGSYGYVILRNGQKIFEGFESFKGTTNNKMELMAPTMALKKVMTEDYRDQEIVLYTDSMYVVNGLNDWIAKWKRNNWKRGKDSVKNVDLWKELDNTRNYFTGLRIAWVKGHAVSDWNNYVDNLCNLAVK